MRQAQAVFVDSEAWIALALSRDPLHVQAREQWNLLHAAGAKLHTSVPVVIETFHISRSQRQPAVDATSFAIMKRERIRLACTFDHHFAAVGFRLVT
jgi:predicted nucleic acid-binding protein